MVQRLKQTFGDATPEEQSAQHIKDLNTIWFGVIKEANQCLSLHYSTRLVDIMQDSQSGEYQERFPQLVSFVGQTGKCPWLRQTFGRSCIDTSGSRRHFFLSRSRKEHGHKNAHQP